MCTTTDFSNVIKMLCRAAWGKARLICIDCAKNSKIFKGYPVIAYITRKQCCLTWGDILVFKCCLAQARQGSTLMVLDFQNPNNNPFRHQVYFVILRIWLCYLASLLHLSRHPNSSSAGSVWRWKPSVHSPAWKQASEKVPKKLSSVNFLAQVK